MKTNTKKSWLGRMGIVLVGLGLVGGGGYLLTHKSVTKQELVKVSVRLKWLHQAQFAGHYVAEQKGYYRDKGIEVELKPFDYENYPIDEVVAGKAQFGVTGADELLIARSKGAKIVAIAVIYQDSPVVAYALASSGIKEPKDMLGKIVGIEPGINVETTIKAMLARQGIEYSSEITTVPVGFEVTPLLNGEVDVSTGYETNEPIQVEEAGQAVNIIAPYKYGIKMYGDVLFTTQELIENNPKLVESFVSATLAGWDYALLNPREAVELTLKYEDPNNTSLNYDHQWRLLDKSISLIKPTKGAAVGEMNYSDWKRTYELLRNSGLIEKEMMDVTDAFNSRFLE